MAVRFDAESDGYSDSSAAGNTFTIMCWCYLSVDRNDFSTVFDLSTSTSSYMQVSTDNTGTVLGIHTSSGGVDGVTMTVGAWHRLAVTCDGTTMTLYTGDATGALSSGTTPMPSGYNPSTLRIGWSVWSGEFFNGRVANVKVWDSVLTAAQVEAEFTQYQPLTTSTLIRWYPLLVSELVDYSGQANTLTAGGTTPATEDGPPLRWARTRGPRVTFSGPKVLAPASIPSAESVGVPTLRYIVAPASIPSAESVGVPKVGAVIAPLSVPTAESVGVPTIIRLGTVVVTSVPSAESVGVPLLIPGTVTIFPLSVPSAESVGVPKVKIVLDVTTLTPRDRQRRTPIYELLAVRRIPATTGPPAFLDVDRIKWSSLTWSSTLSRRQELSATVATTALTEPVIQLLRDPEHLPCELVLLRNGSAVFAGPLLTGQQRGRDLQLTAGGLLTYLEWMIVEETATFVQADQFTIAAALIDAWQNNTAPGATFGHFGIDTSHVGLSGKLRDRTYDRNEIHYVDQRLAELGAVRDGFDFEIDPTTRRLQLWTPTKGVDRSAGETAIVFDGRTGDAQDGMFALGPGDLASDAYGSGSTAASETPLWSQQPNPELRASFGRTAVAASWSDVSEQATLDDHVAALRDARAETLRAPGRKVRVTPSADLSAYDVGDTVSYQLDAILRVGGAYRIRSRSVNVDAARQETVDLEFV